MADTNTDNISGAAEQVETLIANAVAFAPVDAARSAMYAEQAVEVVKVLEIELESAMASLRALRREKRR